jgi:hypothetical protein
MESNFFGKDGFIWWKGVIEDRKDPIFLGRVRVRIFGWHTDDKTMLPTADLPWALPSLPIDNGRNPVGFKEGDWCWGFFLDGPDAQKPIVIGYIPGIDEKAADPSTGFSDPTTPEELASTPRPPSMTSTQLTEPFLTKVSFLRLVAKLDPPEDIISSLIRIIDALFLDKEILKLSELPTGIVSAVNEIIEIADEITDEVKSLLNKAVSFVVGKITELTDLLSLDILENGLTETASRFANDNILPGTNLAFGELRETFDITKSKFDVDKNGEYNADDAELLIKQIVAGGEFFDGYADVIPQIPISSYPLTDRLNEPSTSRLSRNENIEQTIVGLKKQKLTPIEGAGYSGNTVGGSESAPTSFIEPTTPYNAVYPYNHVYESESGHVMEVDDTPGAERLHRYHRSGTFNEVHPSGDEVNRVVKCEYNIIYEDYFNSTGKSYHVETKAGSIKLKSAQNINLQVTSNLNQQVGSDLNSSVGGNVTLDAVGDMTERVQNRTSLIESDFTESIGGSEWRTIAEGVYINTTGGPVKIKSAKKIQLISEDSIDLIAPSVNIKTDGAPATFHAPGLDVAGFITAADVSAPSMNSVYNSFFYGSAFASLSAQAITSLAIGSNLFTGNFVGGLSPGPVPVIPPLTIPPLVTPPVVIPPSEIENSDDDKNNQLIEDALKKTLSSGDGGPKYGFFIPNGVVGDVWKPVSDSNGNLVTLSATMGTHELREAIPTGALESVLIKYEDPSGAITEWQVVRPVHIPGKLIDTPTKMDMFEDGVRQLARWSKPGASYPKQLFWIVNGRPMLILDSSERHQCKFGPYNDKLS